MFDQLCLNPHNFRACFSFQETMPFVILKKQPRLSDLPGPVSSIQQQFTKSESADKSRQCSTCRSKSVKSSAVEQTVVKASSGFGVLLFRSDTSSLIAYQEVWSEIAGRCGFLSPADHDKPVVISLSINSHYFATQCYFCPVGLVIDGCIGGRRDFCVWNSDELHRCFYSKRV